MLTTGGKNNSDITSDDGPSVLGRFTWAVVGRTCVPCLLKNDNTKYVSVRMAESEVLGHFLHKLNTEVFNCISVKSFGITEAENKLLNDINCRHCDSLFGKEPFSIHSDFIVRLDDLIEFYKFMDTCYSKLLLPSVSTDKNHRCGFLRINDDSVVPYAVKDDRKYVPLFYFEGETDSLKTKAITLDNWDLAYLKFCCKVQGIKNELFASDKCQVTSLDDVKSFFPEGTKFDDYWPSKIIELQPSTNRAQMNGNYAWVQTPPVVTSTVPPPQPAVPANRVVSTAVCRQPYNQRVSSTATIPTMPVYQAWPSTMSNSAATVTSSTYPSQARAPQKINSTSMHSMNSNTVMTPRTYVNQNTRVPNSQYYMPPNNVPNSSGTIQHPPPLVRASAGNSIHNVCSNTVPSGAYSSHMYQNNNQMVSDARHMSNPTSTAQQQHKSRSAAPNQVVNSTVPRYPQTLSSLNGTGNVIQAAANSTSSNAGNNAMSVNNRQQRRAPFPQSAGEIIDLSSPPHSPPHNMCNAANTIASRSNSNHNLPPLQRINDASQLMTNSMPQYKVETVNLFGQSVPAINLNPYSDAEHAISLQDIVTYYFPRVDTNKLRNWLQNVLGINLYEASPAQIKLLREYCKNVEDASDELPLLRVRDFESNYPRITYLQERDITLEQDPKRQKVS